MNNQEKPAFPNQQSFSLQGDDGIGLTKREYFAAMALQGILAYSPTDEQYTETTTTTKAMAIQAVKMADELLKALEP